MAEIMHYSAMPTPGVVVEGNLVHADELRSREQIREWVSK